MLSHISLAHSHPTPGYGSVAPTPAPGVAGCFVRVPLYLEVPPSLMEVMPLPNPVPRWFIHASAVETTLQRFAQMGMPHSLLNNLRQPDRSVRSENWVVFFPPSGELASLDPALRAAVYQVLNSFPRNEDIVAPVVFTDREDLRHWFAGTLIRTELVGLIEQFAYPRGNALAFSDMAILIGQTHGEAEARRVMTILNRTRTLQLKIAIQPGSDPAKIAAPWASARGDQGWRAATLISSWCHAKAPGPFDVTHLLPQIPRMLLYTFPNLSIGMSGGSPDAHWTTLHFFRSEAASVGLENTTAASQLIEGLTPVNEPYQFGDVLVYWSATQQKIVHSCVFVADGIVFTKNSPKLISPWVLQEQDIVKNIHLSLPGDHIRAYRKVVAGL